MTPGKKKPKDFESAIGRLEQITELMESGESSLEDSISLYTEGIELARFCNKQLSDTEEKIKMIAEENGLFTEVPFERED